MRLEIFFLYVFYLIICSYAYAQNNGKFEFSIDQPMTNEEFIVALCESEESINSNYIASKIQLLKSDLSINKKIELLLLSLDQDIKNNHPFIDKAYRLKGDYYFATHQWNKAIDCLEKSLELENNENPDTLMKLSIAICYGRNDYQRAIAYTYDAMDVIKNNKNKYSKDKYSISLLTLCLIYFHKGDYNKALEILDNIKDYPNVFIVRGNIYWELRDYRNAILCWESGKSINNPRIQIRLAYSYFMTDQYEKLKKVMNDIHEADISHNKLELSIYLLLQHVIKMNLIEKS